MLFHELTRVKLQGKQKSPMEILIPQTNCWHAGGTTGRDPGGGICVLLDKWRNYFFIDRFHNTHKCGQKNRRRRLSLQLLVFLCIEANYTMGLSKYCFKNPKCCYRFLSFRLSGFVFLAGHLTWCFSYHYIHPYSNSQTVWFAIPIH